ncbi:hypothetical protein QUF72_01495 [Desulfobacterales bacterium HSG2]|nr:hypothetical protein [Desulfobacterales bacterium HSG2]
MKPEKLIMGWRRRVPVEVLRNQLIAVLEKYFPGQYTWRGGSHIVVQDDNLKGLEDYGSEGDFSIPVKSGKKVKRYYIKRLVKTIDLLEQMGVMRNEKRP